MGGGARHARARQGHKSTPAYGTRRGSASARWRVDASRWAHLCIDVGILVHLQGLELLASARLLDELHDAVVAAIRPGLAALESCAERLEHREDQLDVGRTQ